MNRLSKLLVSAVACLSFMIFTNHQSVHAADTYYKVGKIHSTTPTSWRGNWYSYVNGKFCLTQVNKYSVTQKYDGKKHTLFKSSWKGYRKLAFAKINGTNRYTFNALAKKAYQSDKGWRVSHRTVESQRVNVLRDYSGGTSYVDLFRSPVYKSYSK
ncbi:hypothetical protein LASUN_10870 [Lentilactobacillus sunkii]|jgi:uncharacterized protein (DUF1684 family)|uniref:Uncharacterized protein n=1 Tax=Lentilactobacillus sunkii TaxID=481719 RepID=A0A1E7XDB5_9LACO|nr:hypothetical protein [Lentilactobacillus sunkii]OFA11018.1 hypothetical protein LASUN_10870 [Lentilactobacillus sunkii]